MILGKLKYIERYKGIAKNIDTAIDYILNQEDELRTIEVGKLSGKLPIRVTHNDTKLNNIMIDNEVIAQYAGSVAVECFGIVGMAGVNVKDGLVRLLKMDSLTRGINVSLENNKLNLDFHVIVAYGVSIMAVADNLVDNVKYKVEEFTGLKINKINIFVEGVRVID